MNLNDNAGVLLELDADTTAPATTGVQAGAKSSLLKVISMALLVAGIGTLAYLSFYLAAMRMYQVDECLNVWAARMITTGKTTPGMELFQLILSWVMPAGARAADLFASARLITFMIFWLNLILLALATGERILSLRWLVALAGAATLAPLWDYGFEVRHDNLLLTGVLLMWGVVRFQPPRLGAFFFLGACFIGLEFVSIKAIMYTFPIALGIFVFPPPGARPARWKLFAAWCLGGVVAFVALRFILKLGGLGQESLGTVQNTASIPMHAQRFWPIPLTLPRLMTQTPLLVAMVIAAFITCGATLIRRGRAALNWDGMLPELLLLSAALVALFANPNPYPYNLLHVAPYAFLVAYRYGAMLWKQLPQRSMLAPLALSMFAFTHLTPFGIATHRHWAMSNFRQERLMSLTEDLTDPEKDTIFDGIGMVPTRTTCDIGTFIHGQSLSAMVNTSGSRIRDLLAAHPPSVVILSYRTDWLPAEDHEFIRGRYVPLADDLMVLGNLLPAGGGTFEVFHAGRYRITSAEGSSICGTYEEPRDFKEALAKREEPRALSATIDGVPLNGKPVELSVGTHRLACAPGQTAAVVWMGPHLDEVERMPGNNHHLLFLNWY
jgi:hypothetical protein